MITSYPLATTSCEPPNFAPIVLYSPLLFSTLSSPHNSTLTASDIYMCYTAHAETKE